MSSGDQAMISSPPSTLMTFPVTQCVAGEQNATVAAATSSGVVMRPDGFRAVAAAMRAWLPGIFLSAGVSVTPPRRAFTVIPLGASS